jgi:uncharacterized protein YfdQ (DUF2303 family)
MIDDTTTEAQAVADLAARAAEPHPIPTDGPSAITTPDGRVVILDPESLGLAPRRPSGTTFVHSAEAFLALWDRWADGSSIVYSDRDRTHEVNLGEVVGVLNDDAETAEGAPGWRDRRVRLTVSRSDAWRAWCALDGAFVPLRNFADFVDERRLDIVDPPTADVIELSQSLQISTSSQVSRTNRLDDGSTQILYTEEVTETRAGKGGEITIPKAITFMVPIVEADEVQGRDPTQVVAEFRIRKDGGSVAVGLKIIDRDGIDRRAWEAETGIIGQDASVSLIVDGQPGDARKADRTTTT